MLKKKLAKHINNWVYYQNKSAEIIKYLFDHTELFEEKYTNDYKDSLFRYFGGKITRNTNDMNKLNEILTEQDKMILREEEIERRI